MVNLSICGLCWAQIFRLISEKSLNEKNSARNDLILNHTFNKMADFILYYNDVRLASLSRSASVSFALSLTLSSLCLFKCIFFYSDSFDRFGVGCLCAKKSTFGITKWCAWWRHMRRNDQLSNDNECTYTHIHIYMSKVHVFRNFEQSAVFAM